MSSTTKTQRFLRVSSKEQTFFAKRLAFLVKAGVPILEGLTMIHKQTKSRSMKVIVLSIIHDVSNGKFLHLALGKFKHIFGEFAVSVIRIGEMSGTLDDNLNYLAEELKKRRAMKRKVMGALIYPAIIVVATFGITGMLMVFIFPKILPIFSSLNVELPFTTIALIALSNFLARYGLLVVAGFAALPFLIVFIRRNERVAYALDVAMLHIPIAGKITKDYQMANICRTLGLLLKSDVKVVDAFTVVAETTASLPYRYAMRDLAARVTRGEKIAGPLTLYPKLFPDLVTQMIAIGEQTGRLSETLVYLADLYENEVDETVKNLSSTLEPILMVFMGIIVGFVAVSIITPIYSVTQNIHP